MSLLKNSLADIVPDKCYAFPQVKWTKDSSLDDIAKTYGRKDGMMIWKHSVNKDLVRKRKKPENLQPGDVLTIPPSEAEEKEVKAEIEKWNKTKRATVAMVEVLEDKIKDIETQIEAYYKIVDTLNRKKFDTDTDAEKRKLVDLVSSTVVMIEKGLSGVGSLKPDIVPLPKFDGFSKLSWALQSQRLKWTVEDLFNAGNLQNMRTEIEKAKKEIDGVKEQINKLEEDLNKAGARAVGAICKSKVLKPWGDNIVKQMGAH